MKFVPAIACVAIVFAAGTSQVGAQFSARPDISDSLQSTACTALNNRQLPELIALDANWVEVAATGTSDRADSASQLAHCQIRGRIEPAIRFELYLPHDNDWNGRFLVLGNESVAGQIPSAAMNSALRDGYAVAGTDGGHAGNSLNWLADHALIRDLAYRAVFETATQSERLLTAFYSRPAEYRYFKGCAMGGQQALIQAQHFPDLFDGILAESPFGSVSAAQSTQLWAATRIQPATGRPLLGPEHFALISNAVLAQCDTLDSVADGEIADPRRCNFDPGRLQCTAERSGACLSSSQVELVRSLYSGPSSRMQAAPPAFAAAPHDDAGAGIVRPTVVLPGFAAGSERNWQFDLEHDATALAVAYFALAIHGDSSWNWQNFDLVADHTRAVQQVGWILDASGDELARYGESGGRLLVVHGWADAVSPPDGIIAFFASLSNRNGPQDLARLFMVPGMTQCGGGDGVNRIESQRALEDWVERGIEPDRIEAARIENDAVVRTRPLCPFPQSAAYRGSGSTDESGSFYCTN